jgi:WD40 repeat protein
VAGREGPHVSLSHDALAIASAQLAEESRRRKHGRSRVIDTLFITVPLLILLAVFTWTRMRALKSALVEVENAKGREEHVELLQRQNQSLLESQRAARWPVYFASVHSAQQALDAGDVLGFRQQLQRSMPLRRDPADSPQKERDLRGFEWFYLWRMANAERRSLVGHLGEITVLTVSLDGKRLATASTDGAVKIWDLETGLERASLRAHQGAVNALAFSPDGTLLASGGADKVIRLWDATAGAKEHTVLHNSLRELAGHQDAVLSLGFAANNKALVSAGKDQKLLLWDVSPDGKGDKPEPLPDQHKGAVRVLRFTADGKTMATGGDDQTVAVWDVTAEGKWKIRHTLKGHRGAVQALALAADGKTLASGASEPVEGREVGTVCLWDSASGKERRSLQSTSAVVTALALSDDGQILAVAGSDTTVHLYDAVTAKLRGRVRGHLGRTSAVAFARLPSDNKNGNSGPELLITGSADRTVKIWDVVPVPDSLRGHKGAVHCVAFSPDDKYLASGGADGVVRIWEVATGREKKVLPSHGKAVLAVAFAPDGKQLASAGIDAAIHLWDVDPEAKDYGKQLATLKGHAKEVTALAFDSRKNQKTLASASADETVRLWNVDPKADAFGKERRVLKGHSGPVRCLGFMEDHKYLATGGDDKSIKLWDVEKEKPVGNFTRHTGAVTALAFWPGSSVLLSAGEDRTLRFTDSTKGEEIYSVRVHGSPITAVAFSTRDDSTVVTGSGDRTVKLWDIRTGTERFTLEGHTGPVRAVAYTADHKTIASAGDDGTIRLWRAAPDPLPVAKKPQEHP